MDFNIEVRKKQLDNLEQLISSSRNRVQSVLNYLGWSSENVQKEDRLVQCPVNPHHKISVKSWDNHVDKCVVRIEGYDKKSQFLSHSLDSPTQSIYIDHNKKIELITKELAEKGALRLAWNGLDPDPRTADRLLSTYSPDERLIFYKYCVQETVGPPVPPEFTTTLNNKKPDEDKILSYEEILSQQRDAKRRRAKYKSVHINRKKHTEVIREVINGQMEEYKEWLLAQEQKECNSSNGNEDEKKEDERPHSSISRNSNRSSSSRSTSRRYDRYKDCKRERSRDRRRRSRSYDRKPRYEERDRRSRDDRNNHSRERDRRYSSKERYKQGHDNGRKK